jgi:hypothetical protein
MSDAITPCVEEEFSFAASLLWRHRKGWRARPLALRGPGGLPITLAAALALIGIWRFARRPPRLTDLPAPPNVAAVTEISANLGSYGMGGPGFVGLHLRPVDGPAFWLVFTLWGAACWLTLDDDLVSDGYSSDEKRALAGRWHFRPLSDLVGSKLTEVRLQADEAQFRFKCANTFHVLRLRLDASDLPVHRGSGEHRRLQADQDLRDAVIVTRHARLWV